MKKKTIVQYLLLPIILIFLLAGFYIINRNMAVNYPNPEPTHLIPLTANIEIPILMYHHIGTLPSKYNSIRKDLTVSREVFTDQVADIRAQGFTSIKLEDIYLYATGQKNLPDKPIIFTFDDGYKDVFDNALPTLESFGFTGTIAVITDFQDQIIGDNVYGSWAQIRQAVAKGHEIVSHTHTHFDALNKTYSNQVIIRDLSESIKIIEQQTGLKTKILIYPYGHYSANYIQLAKQSGFELGITTKEGSLIDLNNLMEIPRIRIHRNTTLNKLRTKLNQNNLGKSPTIK